MRGEGARPDFSRGLRGAAAALLVFLSACAPAPDAPAPALSVLCWNLDHYGPADRDGNFQADNPKPEEHVAALLGAIAEARADVLVLQEMGNAALLADFQRRLAGLGAPYPHGHLVEGEDPDRFLALLSRRPLFDVRLHAGDGFSIGGTRRRVERGFIEASVEAAPGLRLRLFAAHLRSRSFHPLGQTEMRRNEARILGQHVRRARREFPAEAVLVAGTLNDLPGSAVLRELGVGEAGGLADLRPSDAYGDAWTARDAAGEVFERLDYLLLSEGGGLRARELRLLHTPELREASRHRALCVAFDAEAPAPVQTLDKK